LPRRRLDAKSSLRALGDEKIKILKGLSNSKYMVFKVKKLLKVGVDLMLQPRGKKKRSRRNEWQFLWI
jgi:hypothetical protein